MASALLFSSVAAYLRTGFVRAQATLWSWFQGSDPDQSSQKPPVF